MTPIGWAILVWLALALIRTGRTAVAAFDSPIEIEHDETAPDPTAPGGTA